MSKYNTGDKFVVEINEVMESDYGTLYRADFSTLVFDDYGLDNLPQLVDGVNEACYNKGLADAWEAARKVGCLEQYGGMSSDELYEVFDDSGKSAVLNKVTAQEAIAKIKEWKGRKEIRRGDEVIYKEPKDKESGIVTLTHEDDKGALVLWQSGNASYEYQNSLTKTGRNFADRLDALLGEIGEEQ